MMKVKDILERIEHRRHECIDENEFTYDALSQMADKSVECILVLKEGSLVGIFSEHGYARDVVNKGQSSWKTVLKTIMRTDFSIVSPDTPITECVEIIRRQRGDFIPVMDQNNIVGVLSLKDLDQTVMREQSAEIELLKNYIYDRRL